MLRLNLHPIHCSQKNYKMDCSYLNSLISAVVAIDCSKFDKCRPAIVVLLCLSASCKKSQHHIAKHIIVRISAFVAFL
ncbi:hypothetical protein Tsubulata_036781 [Turnera subulata]|uniref:Uncharacterized protein n=1 Tax=Turnera subulata TaxID=218843 RepID=A0A9Q0EYI8_9ROSI|nr:hypothetical protein Tsubulata_036781 [Turnera subulata]